MSVIDKVTKHFNESVDNNLKKFYVSEWDLDVYYYPTYSFKDESKVMQAQSAGKTVDALIETIIVKARDGEGKRLFKDADRSALMNEADPTIVIKVAGAINNGEVSSEEIVKN
jgi:hypothetical protein